MLEKLISAPNLSMPSTPQTPRCDGPDDLLQPQNRLHESAFQSFEDFDSPQIPCSRSLDIMRLLYDKMCDRWMNVYTSLANVRPHDSTDAAFHFVGKWPLYSGDIGHSIIPQYEAHVLSHGPDLNDENRHRYISEVLEFISNSNCSFIFNIFVDGSFFQDDSSPLDGWAFAILLQFNNSFSFIGYVTGETIVESTNRFFFGIESINSFTSEVSGMFWVIKWAIQISSQ